MDDVAQFGAFCFAFLGNQRSGRSIWRQNRARAATNLGSRGHARVGGWVKRSPRRVTVSDCHGPGRSAADARWCARNRQNELRRVCVCPAQLRLLLKCTQLVWVPGSVRALFTATCRILCWNFPCLEISRGAEADALVWSAVTTRSPTSEYWRALFEPSTSCSSCGAAVADRRHERIFGSDQAGKLC